MIFELGLAFILGLLFGSFSNVVILRWPKGESFVSPRSHCPHCSSFIAWYDNIPVLSWMALGAKCRKCKAPISWRYPFVELLTGVAFVAVVYVFGVSWSSLEYLIFVWALILVSVIDLDEMLLPDIFTLSGVVIGLLGGLLNPERSFSASVLGVALGGGFLWLIAWLYFRWRGIEGMGGGDIKLLAWIGAVMGWTAIPMVVLVASVLGSLAGLLVMSRRSTGLKSVIPFGPFLAFAAIVTLFAGDSLSLWYVSLFLPSFVPVN